MGKALGTDVGIHASQQQPGSNIGVERAIQQCALCLFV
jgi:hypothetical protein